MNDVKQPNSVFILLFYINITYLYLEGKWLNQSEPMNKLISFFETRAFGVCSYFGQRLGIASASIRLFFIYLSFFTFGSPIIIYMALVFVMNMHKHLRNNRKPVWDI